MEDLENFIIKTESKNNNNNNVSTSPTPFEQQADFICIPSNKEQTLKEKEDQLKNNNFKNIAYLLYQIITIKITYILFTLNLYKNTQYIILTNFEH